MNTPATFSSVPLISLDSAASFSSNYYRAILHQLPHAFCVGEVLFNEQDTPVDYRLVEVNATFEQQIPLPNSVGRTLRELAPAHEASWYERLGQVVRTGQAAHFEQQAPYGEDSWYEVQALPAGPPGSHQVALLLTDITAHHQAETTWRSSQDRQAFLLRLGDELRPLLDAVQVQAVAARLLGQFLHANQVHYGETQGEYVVISQGYGNGLPAMTGRFRSVDFGEKLTATHRAGTVQVVSDIETDEANTEAERQVLRQARIGAYITVPLVKEGQWVATLAVHCLAPRLWTVDEVRLVEDVAERTWAAVERARTETDLRASEALLQKAFSIDTVGLLFFTLDGHMTNANSAFEHLSGYPREALLTADWNVLTPPEFRDVTARAVGELAERGETAPYEKQLVRPDGSRWWALCAPTRLRGDGSTAECIEFTVDISARKQAEEQFHALLASLEQQVAERTQALRANQELLQLVFDTSAMAISVQAAVRDAQGDIQDFRVLLLNKELARELGRSDMVGKHYVQEYPGMKASGLFGLMRATVETGEPQQMEYYYPFEGFNRWFSCTFVKLNDGVVATNLDITPRKQAEEERFRNFALLQQSEEVAGMGSWDYHVATGAFRWSDGMYRLFGLPLGTPVTPHVYLDVVLAEDRPIAERLVHQLLQEPSSFEQQLRVRVAGQVKTLRLKTEVLRDAAGQPERVLGVDLDSSEVLRLEAENLHLRLSRQRALFEAVQQAQETERKRIAEGLHNGIGQLLFATKLRLDQLHAPVLNAEPDLAAARREADRLLAEAIRQTRVLSHELVPTTLAEFGLAAALQDICYQLSTPQLLLRCHVVLDEQVPPLPPLLQLALYRMAQELGLNIVKHAWGATEASLELETTPGFVLLRAEDNGPGFATDAAISPGLGLRTIHDRVALLNGTLDLGHEAGFGTFVRLRIPLPVPRSDGFAPDD